MGDDNGHTDGPASPVGGLLILSRIRGHLPLLLIAVALVILPQLRPGYVFSIVGSVVASFPFVTAFLKGRDAGRDGLFLTSSFLVAMLVVLTFADETRDTVIAASWKDFLLVAVVTVSGLIWLPLVLAARREAGEPASAGSRWERGQRTVLDLLAGRR